ncbi:MAG: hypothetical protein JXQ73_13660 [Phycisphaerae bacterium]|nr:hypothetical protein [Phycisphaerae bacterium]
MTEPHQPNPMTSENGVSAPQVESTATAQPADGTEAAPVLTVELPLRPASNPLGLSLGVQIGALVGLTLFAGMYSLCADELRIAGTIFLTGVTLALAGGAVVGLTCDAFHLEHAPEGADSEIPPSRFWESMWEGTAVGLGILLGALPISLVCSLFSQTPLFPEIIYYTGGVLLAVVGIARARSFHAVPASVAYALIPGLASVVVAHVIGDLLYEQMQSL